MFCLPIQTLVLAAAASSIFFAAKVSFLQQGALRDRYTSGVTTARIAEDLRLGISFSRLTPHDVEFTVPDRSGDGIDDQIHYWWSANPGDPILCETNGGPVETIAAGVQSFELEYRLRTKQIAPLDSEMALLKYNDNAPGGHFHDKTIEHDKWCAQYLRPSFPLGTTKWKIKRAQFMARREGDATEVLDVRLTTADANRKPTEEVIDRVLINETELDDSMTWLSVDFTSANDLDPNDGVCLVIAQHSPSEKAGKVRYNHGGNPMPGDTHWMKSDNAGESWSDAKSDEDMQFYVYGTFDGFQSYTKSYLAGVGITLQVGEDVNSKRMAAVHVVNTPEVILP
jgi:hypothetical protein